MSEPFRCVMAIEIEEGRSVQIFIRGALDDELLDFIDGAVALIRRRLHKHAIDQRAPETEDD
jgi:hypothetical protein